MRKADSLTPVRMLFTKLLTPKPVICFYLFLFFFTDVTFWFALFCTCVILHREIFNFTVVTFRNFKQSRLEAKKRKMIMAVSKTVLLEDSGIIYMNKDS